ncbi:hypothetical protein DCAR_0518940 [Daucus carota subsp. sativus]|uniref:Uncharacterized protein n=1 Tax=Daucus carota subsp. sativus TaxID=79200 RepID=A0AAF1B058_DAUCS|nr:hypothetical protein DCAR_0518940 [Daucus carota subsp. sativus]
MADQMQQSSTASTGMYDQTASASDAGDTVMARWLQSAGLQHLASSLATSGYGAQSAEEEQRLFKLMRNFNLNVEYGSESHIYLI